MRFFSFVITVVSLFQYEKQLKNHRGKMQWFIDYQKGYILWDYLAFNRNFLKSLLINRKLKMFALLKHIN